MECPSTASCCHSYIIPHARWTRLLGNRQWKGEGGKVMEAGGMPVCYRSLSSSFDSKFSLTWEEGWWSLREVDANRGAW